MDKVAGSGKLRLLSFKVKYNIIESEEDKYCQNIQQEG